MQKENCAGWACLPGLTTPLPLHLPGKYFDKTGQNNTFGGAILWSLKLHCSSLLEMGGILLPDPIFTGPSPQGQHLGTSRMILSFTWKCFSVTGKKNRFILQLFL